MEWGRISVSLSCFVLAVAGVTWPFSPASVGLRAQEILASVQELPTKAVELPRAVAERPTPDQRVYVVEQGLSSGQLLVQTFRAQLPYPPAVEQGLETCSEQTHSNDSAARVEAVRCALPHSTDKPGATTPSTDTGGPTQPSAGGPPQPTPSPGGTPSPGDSTTPVPVAGFAYYPPGELDSHDSRQGRKGDRKVYLPNIIFPLRLAPDQHPHMNSQIFGHGGHGYGGKPEIGGSECDAVNYDPMHQRDDYCEVRAWPMPMCPAGSGHQGQDIRPPSCKDNKWEVVAVVDGLITQVTRNTTVKLRGADGTEYWYLHMHPQSITVKPNQTVKQGDVLGHVSNYDGGDANGTTTHLHFQVRQNIRVDGKVMPVFVPGYTSLIAAYRKAKGLDPGIGPDGNLIVDAQLEIGAPKPPAPSAPPATPPSAPPAPDQPLPNPAPPPTAGPTPPEPVPTPPASDQPAPPSAGPTPPEPAPTPPASDQPAPPTPTPTAPAPDQPAPSPAPSPQPPSPVPPPTTEQPAPPPQPPASPPPASEQPAQQPAQSWWQKAWNSAKDWWNKGK